MSHHSSAHIEISPPTPTISPPTLTITPSFLRQNACLSIHQAQIRYSPVDNVCSSSNAIIYPQPAYIDESTSRARSFQNPAIPSFFTDSTPSPPPRYSLFASPPSTPSSILPTFMQSLPCSPCAHQGISANASLKVHTIVPSQHIIVIEVAFQHLCIPTNLVMLHPVGHLLLLRTIHSMGQWDQYLALWRQTLWLSAGGFRRLQLERKNEYWIIQNTDGMYSCAGEVTFTNESIGSTWEGRALLAWERNVFFFLWQITYDMMKGLARIFIRFVHWVVDW